MADKVTSSKKTDTDNSAKINDLLDQVRDLLAEDGTDSATAEALTNFARPAAPAYAGNLADLNRMGQVVVQGKIDTPPGEDDEKTTDVKAAFKEPPAVEPQGTQPITAEISAAATKAEEKK